jgi:hypothetical protein
MLVQCSLFNVHLSSKVASQLFLVRNAAKHPQMINEH